MLRFFYICATIRCLIDNNEKSLDEGLVVQRIKGGTTNNGGKGITKLGEGHERSIVLEPSCRDETRKAPKLSS